MGGKQDTVDITGVAIALRGEGGGVEGIERNLLGYIDDHTITVEIFLEINDARTARGVACVHDRNIVDLQSGIAHPTEEDQTVFNNLSLMLIVISGTAIVRPAADSQWRSIGSISRYRNRIHLGISNRERLAAIAIEGRGRDRAGRGAGGINEGSAVILVGERKT